MALGHPIGASGARILVTLLARAAPSAACAAAAPAICLGGGEATALVVERIG